MDTTPPSTPTDRDVYATPLETPARLKINTSVAPYPEWNDFCVSSTMESAQIQSSVIPWVISTDLSIRDVGKSEYGGMFEELSKPLPDMSAFEYFTTAPSITVETEVIVDDSDHEDSFQ